MVVVTSGQADNASDKAQAGLRARAATLAEILERELGGVLGDHPVERYVASFALAPAMAPYHFVPAPGRAICDAVEAAVGAQGLETYHRLALARLIAEGVPESELRLTTEVRAMRDAYLERVLADLAKGRKGFFRHGHDQFAKDFAVCRGRLMPCGVEVLDPRGGLPRSLLWKGGAGQAVRFARLLVRLGGLRPIWGLHFDRRLVRDFNEAGYAALYLRVADLMAINPQARGVSSWSWWHDPRVAEISPELEFVGRYPESAGALALRAGENATATADALRFAPQRIALHKAGDYRPCVYMLAWPRRDLLAWAADYRAKFSAQSSGPVAA